ncbi:MAG: hypothetical protein WC718_00985 [Phycisphaerales bacterium]
MTTPTAYARFIASMGLESRREAEGYDLGALDGMTAAECSEVEARLMAQTPLSWRDLQALARLGTPRALACLRREVESGSAHGRLEAAVQLHLRGERIPLDDVLEEALLAGLREETLLAETLRAIETLKRTRMVHPLLRATLQGRGESAALCAAMVCFLRGKAQSGFDWSLRPFFLRFNTKDRMARRMAFAELCGRVGEDPVPYLSLSSQPGVAAYHDSRSGS